MVADIVDSRRRCAVAAKGRSLRLDHADSDLDVAQAAAVQGVAQRLPRRAEHLLINGPRPALVGLPAMGATGLILTRYLGDLALPEELVTQLDTNYGTVAKKLASGGTAQRCDVRPC